MADIKAIAEQLVSLTVKEVQELATESLKDVHGIEPAAAAVVSVRWLVVVEKLLLLKHLLM